MFASIFDSDFGNLIEIRNTMNGNYNLLQVI